MGGMLMIVKGKGAAWVWIVGAWALLTGLSLFLRPLMPVDETRYATVAWEMWTRGDFLVPHLNGLPYSDKPPLLFWLFHLGWRVFGVSEGWPRLVPPLFSLANLFLTSALARRLWPERPALAWTAPAVLVGLLPWSLFTGMMMFDMLVAFFVLLALLGLERAWRRGGVFPWVQAGAALGLGILAKGPVVLLAPLFTVALAPWWSGRWPERRWWLGALGAVVIAVAVALSWALPAAQSGGPAYGDALLFSQTEERMVNSFSHGRPWWWYLALLPVLLYPYSLWPPLWKAAGRLRLRAADLGTRLCLAWTIPGLVAFSFFSGKQPHYLLPLLPGCALLAARLLEEPLPAPRRWHAMPAAAFLLLVAGGLAAWPLLLDRLRLLEWTGWVSPVPGLVLGVAALVLLALVGRRETRPMTLTLFSLLLVAGFYATGSGVLRHAYDMGPISRHLAGVEREGRPIAYAGEYHGQFHFLGRLTRPFEVIPHGAEQVWLREHPQGRVVQDTHFLPPGIRRPEFIYPYRTEDLAVWGRESLASPGG
jgi:4-amino-4-deoxy-L-arabinose transferase-like glycosyltransferase